LERKRWREEKVDGAVVRDITFYVGKQKCPILNALRQCLFILLIKVEWTTGKALGNKEGKALKRIISFFYVMSKEYEQGPCCFRSELLY
jgi:hypothetical protein